MASRLPVCCYRKIRAEFLPLEGVPVLKKIILSCALASSIALTPFTATAGEPRAGLAAISIDNFGEINSNYYRGAQPEGKDYAALAGAGIRTVIDLQRDGDSNEKQSVERAGMKFVKIGMTTHVPPTPQQIEQFLTIVNDPANQPVFVHCAGGKHRTGVMTAVYRMTQDKWTSDQAFREMKNYKFGADFLHSEFKRFVYGFRPVQGPVQLEAAATVPAAPVAATPVAVVRAKSEAAPRVLGASTKPVVVTPAAGAPATATPVTAAP